MTQIIAIHYVIVHIIYKWFQVPYVLYEVIAGIQKHHLIFFCLHFIYDDMYHTCRTYIVK